MRGKPFWDRYRIEGSCWVWTMTARREGYGVYWDPRRKSLVGAHRKSWELSYGDIPDGMNVLHSCDNRTCINPTHLFLGSKKDNWDDCASKLRFKHTLDPDTVRDIRRRHAEGESKHRLARLVGVSRTTISRVVNGVSWSQVA